MKRIYLCAALLLFGAAACAPVTNDNANSNANVSNTNAANSNTTTAASWTNDDIIAGEKKAWDMIKAKDYDGFAAALDEKFIDVTPENIYDKAGTVAFVKTFELTEMTLSDFKVLKLDNDAAVVTYVVNLKGTMGGKPIPAGGSRHSSARIMHGGKWLVIYHQSTPIMAMPPPPSPATAANANSANANAANSNAAAATASPATTTADAEANEKLVWEAIRRRDAKAFGNFLMDDAIEVEPDQVYTKSQSVDSIAAMNFLSTAVLSDYRTVVLDDDAKLLTYRVKGTGPNKKPFDDRHSTIWVNRGGKWVAAFHQGTPIAKAGM